MFVACKMRLAAFGQYCCYTFRTFFIFHNTLSSSSGASEFANFKKFGWGCNRIVLFYCVNQQRSSRTCTVGTLAA